MKRARAALGDAQAFLTKAMRWKRDECLLWPYSHNQTGIPMIRLRKQTKSVRALVCESARGYAPSKDHKAYVLCQRPLCVSPAHLQWKNSKEENARQLASMFTTEVRSERTRAARMLQSPERRKQIAAIARACVTEEGRARAGVAARERLLAMTPEQRTALASLGGAASKKSITPERRKNLSIGVKRAIDALSPHERAERQERLVNARLQATTADQRKDIARKANAAKTPEQRSASAKLRWARVSPEERAKWGQIMRAAKFSQEG